MGAVSLWIQTHCTIPYQLLTRRHPVQYVMEDAERQARDADVTHNSLLLESLESGESLVHNLVQIPILNVVAPVGRLEP